MGPPVKMVKNHSKTSIFISFYSLDLAVRDGKGMLKELLLQEKSL